MDEIYNQKYSRIIGGVFGLFKKWIRFPMVLKLAKPQKEDYILEIGCDRGELTQILSRYSQKVIGIDINKEALAQANNKNLFYMSAEKLDFPSEYFDKVVSCHVIEHLPDLKKVFSEIERVLKPKGKCILIFPVELFRGMAAIRDAWLALGNPFLAGKLHLHRLWPNKLKRYTSMKIIKKGIFFEPSLSFYVVLDK
jgi:ubiquinone/menaquinone biosynthesis C-methylase UbiE